MVYRLAYMKKSGNRLSRCPDFVLHYITEDQERQDSLSQSLYMHFRKTKVVFLFIHVLAVVMISVMTVHLCSMAVGKVPEV
ncbi:hypothetical protein C7B06_25850 [Escherichia coli]|nr:hypothetical protein [Escherichia coli]PSY69464.1 hypothetical protein C7B06_25850 [Escherichia coli]PSZ10846.1 hypothetical protein C7B07_25730 [Escherichia coli]